MNKVTTLFLSRLRLNPLSREVYRDLTNIVEMHRTVMRGFGQTEEPNARQAFGVLHRLELDRAAGQATLLVQSTRVPDWDALPAGYLLKDDQPNAECKSLEGILAAVKQGDRLRFGIVANPTKRLSIRGSGAAKKGCGPRVELRGDEARLQWFERHAERAGFRLVQRDGEVDVRVVEQAKRYGGKANKKGRGKVVVAPVSFHGQLVIEQPAAFGVAVRDYIGAGKAYGMGLLSFSAA